ncbi:MAG TPA: hypothetical protein VFM21_00300 [Terriglobia bacterium]|nr:hypothetical protein [Terriglobia bacterium]
MKVEGLFKKIWKVISWVLVLLTALSFLLMILPPSGVKEPSDAAAAKSFDQKLNDLATARQRGSPGEARLTELEVNSKVQQLFEGPPASGVTRLDGMSVHFERDRIVSVLRIKFLFLPLYITLGGQPGILDGHLQFAVKDVDLGRMPLPASPISEALREKLLSPEGQEMTVMPDSITSLRVENGELVIESKSR